MIFRLADRFLIATYFGYLVTKVYVPVCTFRRKPQIMLPAAAGCAPGRGISALRRAAPERAKMSAGCRPGVRRSGDRHAMAAALGHPTDWRCGPATASLAGPRPTVRSACAATASGDRRPRSPRCDAP